jgi:hypothetical protein
VTRSTIRLAIASLAFVAVSTTAVAQDDDPAVLKLAEPDFTLISLPTSLRVPTMRGAFRVTHRFTRPLGQGNFGDLASDMFGIDSGAQIGLEFRWGIMPNTQIGINRTSDKTIQLFGQYSVMRQPSFPMEVSAYLSMDGTNNFQDSYSPAIGAIVSRRFGEVAAVYVEPIWVNNTNPLPAEVVEDNSTFMIGVGTRVRIRPTVYVVGEWSPRAAGYAPGTHHGGFAVEKRAGGHVFQLNFGTSMATTMGQLARGAFSKSDWFMGFNISRKFF